MLALALMFRRGACSEIAASRESMSGMAFISPEDRPVMLSVRAWCLAQREAVPLIQLICRVSAGLELFQRGTDGVLRPPKDAPLFTTIPVDFNGCVCMHRWAGAVQRRYSIVSQSCLPAAFYSPMVLMTP